MNNDNSFELINKEDVPNYHFVTYEVLDSELEKLQRKQDLQKAMIIGNSENHNKIKLFFMTSEGLKEVETTVWAATDTSVELKGGVSVPVHTILRIEHL